MKSNKWKLSALAAFAATSLLLGGCAPSTPNPSPSQTSTDTAAIIGILAPSSASNGQQPKTAVATCAADSVQIPGSHGSYGEVDATFAPAVDALVTSGTSREEANRQVLLSHAKDNVQRLAIWSFAAHLWADPNNTASLERDGCLSPEGQTLWKKLADAVGDASITMGNAPLGGTDSGVVNDKYVVADHPGINGSTATAIFTLRDGVVVTISEWCGNVVFVTVNPVVPTSPVIVQRPTSVPPVVFVPPAKPPVVVPPVVVPKDVQRCDSKTGTDNVTISEETAKDTDRYKPVGDVACHPVEVIKACIKDSGDTTLKPVDKFDDKTMSTNPADCVKPPVNVQRCDSKTGTDNVTISEETAKDTDRYKPVGDVACHPVEVIKACIKDSGDTTLKPVDKFDDKTMSTNPADCVKPPCGCTPPPPVWRCDVTNWTYVQVTPEQAKDTTQYSDVPEVDCVPPVVETCPAGQTPNPNYPASSPDKCLEKKSTNPGDYPHEVGAPPAVADPTPSAPGLDHTTTTTGGRGGTVTDTPTITDPTAPSGVTAPGADAPKPTPPTQVNEGGSTNSNGTISGTVTSAPIDAPTKVAPAPAVNNQAAAAAAQAAANQAAKDAADVAAVQAARAQVQAPAVTKTVAVTTTKAAAPATVKVAPAAAPTTSTTAAGAPMVSVTTPAAPAASVGG